MAFGPIYLRKTVISGSLCVFQDEGTGDGHVTCRGFEDHVTPISATSQVEVM